MDLLTTSKIPYLYPLSKKEYCFYVEKAGSLFTMISSIVFLILLGLLVYNSSDIFLLNLYANVYTIFFIAYYIYRILSKILISLDLKKDYKYFLGISPFNYFLYKFNYSGSKISQSIEIKSHFWKKRKIHSVDNILDTEEKEIFMKAIEKCQQIYYYTKWTLFPIFVRNGFIFTVKFFFLETMIKNRTMYIQFDFNKLTHNLINTSRGSGIISTIS